MTPRLTEEQLMQKLLDPQVPLEALLPYFAPDPATSKPFAPNFKIRDSVVERDLQVESALGLNLLNWATRIRRQADFRAEAPSRPNDLRLISDGDSWYLHPLIVDTVNHLFDDHLVFSLDGAGDELEDIVRARQALRQIDRVGARGVMLSGGGNDLVGGGSLVNVLENAPDGSPAEDYVDDDAFGRQLEKVFGLFEDYIDAIHERHSGTHVFLHGYGHAIPVPGGKWLGSAMAGIVPETLWSSVVRILIDRFNDRLGDFADDKGGLVHYIDARPLVQGRWFDELHPTDDGYGDVAARFSEVIEDALRPPLHAAEAVFGQLQPLPELAPHMTAPVEPAQEINSQRRRAAQLMAEGAEIAGFQFEAAVEFGSEAFVNPIPEIRPEVIIGLPDFQPARFLRDGARRAEAVCRVRLPGGSGTGSLLTGNRILTNWHVLPDAGTAAGAIAEFGFEEGGALKTVRLTPDVFFMSNQPRDFAIVACEAGQLDDVAPLTLSLRPNAFIEKEPVNIIQHPAGRPKEIAIRSNKIVEIHQGVIHYLTDTEPGSSGSPVFNDSWDLIGLHRAGLADRFNQAIRIDAIAAFLESEVRSESTSVESAALEVVSGTSPHLGFFGRAGIVDEMRPEVEIPTFRGDKEFADIGFWNIENYFGEVPDARIERVAKLLADINMDALGLIEVSRDAVSATVRHMNAMGERAGFVFLDAHGQRDLAILFDRDTAEVVPLDDVSERHAALIGEKIEGKSVFPRAPLIAAVKVADPGDPGTEFVMIVVHLKSKAGRNRALSAKRRRRAAEILRIVADDVRETTGKPVIIGGDYNEELSNDVLSGLTDAPDFFTLTQDDEEDGAISYLSAPFRSLIDHVIVSGDLRTGEIEGDDLAIVRFDRSISDFDELFSDHTPLVMRLIMRDEPIAVAPEAPAEPGEDEDFVFDIPDDADEIVITFGSAKPKTPKARGGAGRRRGKGRRRD